jgi:long-chain acyl-CoA synthetase
VYLPGLIQGASVVLLRKFEAGSALDVIERFGCTYTFALPAFLQLMAEEQAARPRNVSSLRGIIAGGDSAPAALQRRVRQQFHVELQEGLGMTEVVPIAITPHGAVRVGSVGPAASASIRILDAKRHGDAVDQHHVTFVIRKGVWAAIGRSQILRT